MKALLALLIAACFSATTHASQLKEFCESDPTGELYSEIWDSSIEDGLQSIGLNPGTYEEQIEAHPDSDLFDLAFQLKDSHPELSNALDIWKLQTCITRGFEMLMDSLSSSSPLNAPQLNLYDDQDLYCEVTSDNKRYEDQFIIEVRKEGLSKIKYRRKHLASPEGRYGEIEIVRGCFHAKQVGSKHHPQMISVECQENGQEGMASVDSNTLAGWLYFYYPKVGYGERTELQIQCKRY